MHGVLAHGHALQIVAGDRDVSALDYLLEGGVLAGFDPAPGDMIEGSRGLRFAFQPSTKVGQGHRDQWLAILAQCDLSLDQQIAVPWGEPNLEDVLRQAEWDVPLNYEAEFSWTLIGLSIFRSTKHTWVARDGNRYSTELLLQSELTEDLADSVCGGTHRLIGIAMVVRKRRAEGLPMTGVWAEAEAVLNAAVELGRQNQNGDGSFSPSYLHRPGWARDLGEQLGTTGHVLEFIALAASQEELRSPWIERTVERVCVLLDQCHEEDLECGALYHAVHGLQEYLAACDRHTGT